MQIRADPMAPIKPYVNIKTARFGANAEEVKPTVHNNPPSIEHEIYR